MNPNFWLARWENNHLGWHLEQAHPMLVSHLGKIADTPETCIFIPLCGKTLDIEWLLTQGYRVAGAELSEIAVGQMFEIADIVPEVTDLGKVKRYSAPRVDIFVGNIFDLTQEALGPVDVVFDRAALVALPKEMRQRYALHLTALVKQAPQVLVSFDYDQNAMAGPPFSVPHEEINDLYQDSYAISLLSDENMPDGLKGICPAREQTWMLTAQQHTQD